VREQTRGGGALHVVLETSRLAALRAELGPTRHVEVLTDRRASDEICLVRVELELAHAEPNRSSAVQARRRSVSDAGLNERHSLPGG
jgi:hypothetical protein